MIVRSLQEMEGTERSVSGDTWTSRRLLLAEDRMGFSLHDTIIEAGTTTTMWYKNHFEAVYCIEGEGEIEELDTGLVHQISPGVMYALNLHDRHELRARTQLRLVCAFNPPCTGAETHDETGAYPLLTVDGGSTGGTSAQGGSADGGSADGGSADGGSAPARSGAGSEVQA